MTTTHDQIERVLDFLKEKGPALDSPLPEIRRKFDDVTQVFEVPRDVDVSQTQISGSAAYWVVPPGALPQRILLYFHGGGYVVGSAKGFLGVASAFAREAAARALVLDYRLAPEHPCPAALDDAVNTYGALLELGYPTSGIGLIGGSAGAGLAMALLATLQQRQLPLPAAATLISPWIDQECSGASMKEKAATDPMLSADKLTGLSAAFLQGQPIPSVFEPLKADLRGLPPLLIQVGSREVLLDDATRLAARAASADVSVTLRVWPGMLHDWPLFSPMLSEGQRAIGLAGDFFKDHFAKGSSGEM